MSTIVNVFEAKTHLSQLLERARAGENIILAKNGKPYARLVAIGDPTKRQLGFIKGNVDANLFDPLPEEELREWE